MSATATAAAVSSWRGLTTPGRPHVFTIPATTGFVDALAAGLWADADGDPMRLARATVLLPTRRACRALREAFLRRGGGAPVLLPRLMALNDLDEDEALLTGFAADVTTDIPPPIDGLKRQLMLAALILKRDGAGHDQAVALAAELARLLDRLQTENVPLAKLQTLVPDDYAAHWQQILRFLEIVTTKWPEILREEGCLDPIEHRNHVFAAQGAAWRALSRTMTHPIVAAGSTGSIPATAELLKTVAHLPLGCVVLPGLDQTLDEDGWAALDDSHPQFGLKHLLAEIGLDRAEVKPWPGTAARPDAPRLRLTAELMRPAATTDRWPGLALPASAVDGIACIVAPTPREEAAAIAMAMRETLEAPAATCALVTPDRELARRVASELERWGIAVDDSGGRALEATPVGAFLQLVAEMAAADFAPLATLAACKHPLAAGGLDPAEFRELTRLTERMLLRGPRPAPGLAALRTLAAGLKEQRGAVLRWVEALERACGGLAAALAQERITVADVLETHMRAAEALAASAATAGPLRLWAGDDGESAAALAANLAETCGTLPPLTGRAYPALFRALLKGRVVRPRYGKHPRLSILGPLEARLQRFDTVILGGLNEGTWPATPATDPWLSRPMKAALGLQSPERRIGLAAHDIAEALCGPRVILTRSRKVDGAPTVPSRWLKRLDQVLAAAKLPSLPERAPWLDHARAVTLPAAIASWSAPAPCPPLAARPRALSATQIETWMRDPYAVYARHVLRLTALETIDADAAAADYGTLIHRALQTAVREGGEVSERRLLEIGAALFAEHDVRPAVRAFWWPRFQRIARWFAAQEAERRGKVTASLVETRGTMTLPGPGGDFTLSATADRIDVLDDGTLAIIDYKTGTPPSTKEVAAGFAPQLPLEAAIARARGYPGTAAHRVSELAFWHLHGRAEGGTIGAVNADPERLAAEAEAGLRALIAAYDDPDTPYPARPHPAYAPRYSDYEHLARVKEWATAEDGEA